MSKRAEELSVAYTDARLELLRPDIAADNYTRGRKMSLDIFDGNEVESAYEAGYEQAIKEVTREIHKYVATRFIANREKIGLSTYAAGRTEEDKLIMDYIEKLEKEYE